MPLASALDFLLLAAIWGSSFLFMRLAVVELGPLPTAAARVGVAALFLLPLVWARGQGHELRRHWKAIAVVGVLNSGLPFALFSFALLTLSTGLSGILNATVPLFGALVAWLWLKDSPTGSRAAGLAIGFLGILLLAWDKAGFRPEATIAPVWGVLACLAATFCYAVAASATKRHLAGVPPLVAACGSQIGATLGLALPALWLWPARMPGLQAWGAVLALGVLCTGVAYILYFRLIEQTGPARAVTVTYAVPVFVVVYGTLFLGERVTPWMVGCGLLVVLGTALSSGALRLPRAGGRGA